MKRKHLEDRCLKICISATMYHCNFNCFGLQLNLKNNPLNSGLSSLRFGVFLKGLKHVSPIVYDYHSPDQEAKINK